MIEEEQVGREAERAPGEDAEAAFVVPAELEAYFNLVEAKEGERAAAEAALAEAERRAAAQADRSMHLTDSAKETVNGALSRIGSDLDAGKDAGDALDGVKEQIVRLQAEERAALAALRNEIAPVAQQPDEPVAEEKPAAPDLHAKPEPAPETPAANPADAWSADQRRDVAAYLDVLDATDRAHAELMKAKRELKKITNTETDEWEVAADKVTALEKAWRDQKADARAREAALGPVDATLVDLDVGRKAGREAVRKQLAEAAPTRLAEAPKTPEPSQVPASEAQEEEPEPEAPSENAELSRRAHEQLERLGQALEESGHQETLAADETKEHLYAMSRALEERSYRNWQVAELRDSLVGVARQLEQWQEEWSTTLRTIDVRREDATLSTEDAEETMTVAASRAEDAESEARVIIARLSEALETARQLASQDDRNNPDGAVLSLAGEIEERMHAIPAAVAQKRDEIFGAREAMLAA